MAQSSNFKHRCFLLNSGLNTLTALGQETVQQGVPKAGAPLLMYTFDKLDNNKIGDEGMQVLSKAQNLPFLQKLNIGNCFLI